MTDFIKHLDTLVGPKISYNPNTYKYNPKTGMYDKRVNYDSDGWEVL